MSCVNLGLCYPVPMQSSSQDSSDTHRIYYTKTELRNLIIHHVLIMLASRTFKDDQAHTQPLYTFTEANYNSIISTQSNATLDDSDSFQVTTNNNQTYHIKIIDAKLGNITRSSPVYSFLNDNINDKKIIIAPDFTDKAERDLDTFNCRIFFTAQMTHNIMQHKLQPTFTAYSGNEAARILLEIGASANTLPPLPYHDAAAKYYDFKKGDIIRVKDDSTNTAVRISYKVVLD